MTFTLHEDLLRAALSTADGLEDLNLPDDGDGALPTDFDPRMDPDHTSAFNSAIFNAMGTIVTSDVEGAKVDLHVIDDETGGYTFVTISVPYGDPQHGYRPSLKVAGNTEEARKIGSADEGVTPVEQVVAIFTEVVDEGNRLLSQLATAAAALTPAPTVEVLHERDPDSECTTRLWLNGALLTDYAIDDVDPGRGYQAHDIHETIEATKDGDHSPAFTAASVQAWTDALDSGYTTHD